MASVLLMRRFYRGTAGAFQIGARHLTALGVFAEVLERTTAANIAAESVSEAAHRLEQMGKIDEIAGAATEFVALKGELETLARFAQKRFASCKAIVVGPG